MAEKFCTGCVDDIQWLIADDLHRIAGHPNFNPGFAPRYVECDIMDDDEKIMRSQFIHVGTLHQYVHHADLRGGPADLGRITRRMSFHRFAELSGTPDQIEPHDWDFSRLDGGVTPAATFPLPGVGARA